VLYKTEYKIKYLNEVLLIKVFNFIDLNYTQQIGLRSVAKEVNYSPAYLTDLIRRRTGKTVVNWIIERRLIQASILLLETNYTIEKIAYSIGYQNLNHFYNQFGKRYCTSPRKYQQNNAQLYHYIRIDTPDLTHKSST